MSSPFDARHWLNLSLAKGIGGKTLRKLLGHYGSPGAILDASFHELRRQVPAATARSIRDDDRSAAVTAALKWLETPGTAVLTLADEQYPPPLLETADPPALLYARGNLSMLGKPMVAVVGSRSASAAGLRNTEIFARALSQAGCCIVSGLAQGIDSAAHRGALSGGSGGTIAVVGTGLDMVYPRENRALMGEISEKGLLLSEFALGTRPLPDNFPRRNRIISGLSRACLVMEAVIKSGSLITARLAAEQGREVFAVPGSINSPLHRGCHQLIKQGAKLAENVNDILEELQITAPPQSDAARYEDSRNAGTQTTDANLLTYINYQPTSIDDIAVRSGIAAEALMPALLGLEMAGKIVSTAGGGYQRV